MARSHLTLAALATSAVPELDIVGATPFGAGRGSDFDAAILTGRDGRHWIIRVPNNERAEAEQSADLVALRALSAGVRSRLPFAVSAFVGQVPVDGTRAIVYEFVVRHEGAARRLRRARSRPRSGARSPPSTRCRRASSRMPACPSLTAGESQRACMSVMDRAAATGLVPAALTGAGSARSRTPSCGSSSRW